MIFTAWQTLEESQLFYRNVKSLLVKNGRTADELKIMPGIFPVIGTTEAEAREKDQLLQQLVLPSVGLGL